MDILKSDVLKTLDSFSLEDIQQAIEEVNTQKGRVWFGKSYDNLQQVLYILAENAEKKLLNIEIHDLKQALVDKYKKDMDHACASAKVYNIWGFYQNKGKGQVFVRDALLNELYGEVAQ